jgi:hypothetical protein
MNPAPPVNKTLFMVIAIYPDFERMLERDGVILRAGERNANLEVGHVGHSIL